MYLPEIFIVCQMFYLNNRKRWKKNAQKPKATKGRIIAQKAKFYYSPVPEYIYNLFLAYDQKK